MAYENFHSRYKALLSRLGGIQELPVIRGPLFMGHRCSRRFRPLPSDIARSTSDGGGDIRRLLSKLLTAAI
ncbi:hypothetical protein Plhal710r2_c007g0034081 [Plasmopara halstedii]